MIPGSETNHEPGTNRTTGSKTKPKDTTQKTKHKQLGLNVETVGEWQSITFGRSEGFSWFSGSDTNKTDQHFIIYDSIWNGYQKEQPKCNQKTTTTKWSTGYKYKTIDKSKQKITFWDKSHKALIAWPGHRTSMSQVKCIEQWLGIPLGRDGMLWVSNT